MPMYPSGHENPGVAAVIFLLDDWLQAIENGTAQFRMPDPYYKRPGGKPNWSEEELETLVRDIDAEIDQEVTRAPGTNVGAKAGSGFYRLALPQRLCLAQHLETMLTAQEEYLKGLEPNVAQATTTPPEPAIHVSQEEEGRRAIEDAERLIYGDQPDSEPVILPRIYQPLQSTTASYNSARRKEKLYFFLQVVRVGMLILVIGVMLGIAAQNLGLFNFLQGG